MDRVGDLRSNTSPDRIEAALEDADAVGRWHVDVRKSLIFTDPLVAFLFGFTAERAQDGIDLVEFNLGVHPDDRVNPLERIQQCARDGGWFIAEHRVCSADGQTRRILSRGRFDRDEDGVVSSGSGIVVDITHSQNGEAPLFITNSPSPLEQAADLMLACHATLKESGEPYALALAEALLAELGRGLARAEIRERLSKMH